MARAFVPPPASCWTIQQLQIIEDDACYHERCLKGNKRLRELGPTGEDWPKKPKKDIKTLDPSNGQRRAKEALEGEELHQYLKDNCADIGPEAAYVHPAGGYNSLADMTGRLKAGWNKLQQKFILRDYLEYGCWLIQAKAQHKHEKTGGTWKSWVETELKIHPSYERKIRDVSRTLKDYPGFYRLSMSFTDVFRLKKQIENLLDAQNRWAEYWKQP